MVCSYYHYPHLYLKPIIISNPLLPCPYKNAPHKKPVVQIKKSRYNFITIYTAPQPTPVPHNASKPIIICKSSTEHIGNKTNIQFFKSIQIQNISQYVHRYSHSRLSDSMYQLPSSITNRTCSFGYGNKVSIVGKDKSPPPGAYESISDFDKSKITRYNTISFSLGRNKVKFGSFLGEAQSKKRNPSPNAYRIKTTQFYSTKGGRMAAKLPSEIDLVIKKRTPGPGTYKMDVTQMKGSGSYILSNFTNNLSPKYHSPDNRSRSRSPQSNRYSLGPGQYQINHEKFGQSIVSKFKNSVNSSFTKQRRPGPDDRSKKNFPGFKYKRFSEFCGVEK